MPPVQCCTRFTNPVGFEVELLGQVSLCPVFANEIRQGTTRSDASDCLHEKLVSFLNARVLPCGFRAPESRLGPIHCAIVAAERLGAASAWSRARLQACTHSDSAGDHSQRAACRVCLQSECSACGSLIAANARFADSSHLQRGVQPAAQCSARVAQGKKPCANTNRTPSATSASAA